MNSGEEKFDKDDTLIPLPRRSEDDNKSPKVRRSLSARRSRKSDSINAFDKESRLLMKEMKKDIENEKVNEQIKNIMVKS